MTVKGKICGLNSPESIEAAVSGGAAFIGIVFYPLSPRYVTPEKAADLVRTVPASVVTVGLFVDPDDEVLNRTLETVELNMLQLHGSEPPERIQEIGDSFGRQTMKAIKVESGADVDAAHAYEEAADWLLFDAKAPKTMAGALPGGNALAFDWELLEGRAWARPWMLSGGLSAENVAEAVRTSGATAVDVSSGVEDKPGTKSPKKITQFLDTIKAL